MTRDTRMEPRHPSRLLKKKNMELLSDTNRVSWSGRDSPRRQAGVYPLAPRPTAQQQPGPRPTTPRAPPSKRTGADPAMSEPPVGIEPTTYSLRAAASADWMALTRVDHAGGRWASMRLFRFGGPPGGHDQPSSAANVEGLLEDPAVHACRRRFPPATRGRDRTSFRCVRHSCHRVGSQPRPSLRCGGTRNRGHMNNHNQKASSMKKNAAAANTVHTVSSQPGRSPRPTQICSQTTKTHKQVSVRAAGRMNAL